MGKRSNDSAGGQRKKYKVSGVIDPGTLGVFATCNRGREQRCRKELLALLMDKIEKWYPDWEEKVEDDEEEVEENLEDKIQKELEELKKPAKSGKKQIIEPIDLSCECLIFLKIRKPVEPADLVHRLCTEAYELGVKTTRVTQKLTPITYSVSASKEELEKLAEKVLKPHFHNEDQKPLKFAIQVSRRNFNALEKEDIINTIASKVGRERGHTVDLKNYDKLILVECFKSNIGMSVVDDYRKLERYNPEQIFDKHGKSSVSRVKPQEDSKEAQKEPKAEEEKDSKA